MIRRCEGLAESATLARRVSSMGRMIVVATRKKKLVDVGGGNLMTVAQAAALYRLGRGVLRARISRGWPIDRALTTPQRYHWPPQKAGR
jgi:hypothetical protein